MIQYSMDNKWKHTFRQLLLEKAMNGGDIVEAQLLKLSNMPVKLYKYCDFTVKNKNNLSNDIVWLTQADNFNDPYDCSLTYSYESVLNNDIERKGMGYILDNIDLGKFAFTDEEKIMVINSGNKIRKILDIMTSKDTELSIKKRKLVPDIFIKAIETIERPIVEINRNKTFVSCFSETNKSIIMWSHYANKHKGFCIEYELKNDRCNVLFFPVFYEKKLFDLTKYLLTKKSEFNNFALLIASITKSNEWKYEKEWRLIPFLLVKEECEWPLPKPTALYIGAKAADVNKIWIKDIAKNKNISIFQSKINNKKFELLFEKIKL